MSGVRRAASHVVRALVAHARWPKTSARSATSPPRSSPPTRARPSTSSPGPTACSPAPRARPRCSRSSTRSVQVRWLVDDGDVVGPGHQGRRGRRPAALGAHRGAQRAELPVPPLGGGDPHAPVRRRRRPDGPDLGHPQDAARAAGGREGGGACRRRREPPRLAVGVRAGEGQPPRRARHHRGGRAARTRAGPAARSRWSATAPSRCRRPSPPAPTMVLLDNMTPDAVRACVSLVRTTAPAGFLVEVSGGDHARQRARLRRRRRRPHLDQRHHAVGARARPRLRPAHDTRGGG